MPFAACCAPVATVSFTGSAAPFRDPWLRGVRVERDLVLLPDRAFVLLPDRDFVVLPDRAPVLLPDRDFVVLPDRALVLLPDRDFVVLPDRAFVLLPDRDFVLDDRLDRPFALELA